MVPPEAPRFPASAPTSAPQRSENVTIARRPDRVRVERPGGGPSCSSASAMPAFSPRKGSDLRNENGLNLDERQLDHMQQDNVRAAYLRSDFVPQRAAMVRRLADWADSEPDKAKAPAIPVVSRGIAPPRGVRTRAVAVQAPCRRFDPRRS